MLHHREVCVCLCNYVKIHKISVIYYHFKSIRGVWVTTSVSSVDCACGSWSIHMYSIIYLAFSYSLTVTMVSSMVWLTRVFMPAVKEFMDLSNASPFLDRNLWVSALNPNSS